MEDFLTEALSDLCETRLTSHEARDLIVKVLLKRRTEMSHDIVRKVTKQILSAKLVEWEARQIFRLAGNVNKYPDICIIAAGAIVVIIEVKISAAFTKREISVGPADPDRETRSQLEDYGRELKRRNPNAGLVLLTSSTVPPEGYLENGSYAYKRYGIRLRSVCNWRQIHDWLQSKPRTRLAIELATFLEDKGLDDMNKADVNALRVFLGRPKLYAKITEAMSTVEKPVLALLKGKPRRKWSAHFSEECVKTYIKVYADYQLYLEWGFAPGDADSYFLGLNLTNKLYAYVGRIRFLPARPSAPECRAPDPPRSTSAVDSLLPAAAAGAPRRSPARRTCCATCRRSRPRSRAADTTR